MDPDPRRQPRASRLLVELPDSLKNRQTGARGPLGVVIMRLGIAEERHHAVTQVLGDVAAKLADRSGGSAMILGHRLAPFLGIELGGDLGRTDQVTEQHRQMAPLARERIARSDGGSFRLRYVDDCVKRSPASVAELGAWLVSHAATGWTRRKRKGRAALAAEPGTLVIFCPAFG